MTHDDGSFGRRDVVRLVVGALVAAAVVTALSLVVGFPLARTLQWALLAATCTVAAMLLGRLPVHRPRWPDLPQPPAVVGWHGLRSADERLRRARTTRRGRRPGRRSSRPPDATDLDGTTPDDAEG